MPEDYSILLSVLRATKDGRATIEEIRRGSRTVSSALMVMLENLEKEGLIHLVSNEIRTNAVSRVRLAVKALCMGAGIDSISHLLQWREFEEIAGEVLRCNDYDVLRNVRFKSGKSRKEIDVVGLRNLIAVCIDCKHWQRTFSDSSLKLITDAQTKRTETLADSFPFVSRKLISRAWRRLTFVPVVLSLVPARRPFFGGVPVVAVLQFQDFINHLSLNLSSVEHFDREYPNLANS